MAIAVALANGPEVLLADEPTGELDTDTSAEIFDLLRRMNRELGTTIVIVTHDPLVSEQVQRTVAIRDGRTSSETLRRSSLSDDGDHQVIAEEFAVLDRAGSAAAAAGPRRGARARAPRPPPAGAGSHRRLAGRPRGEGPMTERFAADRGGAMVVAEGLTRDYPSGDGVVHALRGIDLRVERGQLVAVRGRSGSGKTTLLNLLGGLDRPTTGRVTVDGEEVSAMSESQLVAFRRGTVAFIFQAFGLLPILSAAENVEVPLRLVRADPRARDARVDELLELVGLGPRAGHRPYELSGGEQQRVAIARALANRPKLLLADEPTGQLDSHTGHAIMELLRTVVRTEGVTAVVATHDPALLDLADRVVEIHDGMLVESTESVPHAAGR